MKELDPMNILLLIMEPSVYKSLLEVKSRDIFEQNSTEFNREGLFSDIIFGPTGSKERMINFGYIDLNIKILHPRIYKEVSSLSTLYKGILNGNMYAVFDEKEKDFILADKATGKTGYNFFLKHYEDIEFKRTKSIEREFKIKFIRKYTLKQSLTDKYLVIPAGLRDYVITESGKPLENEINTLYRKILTVASTARQFKDDTSDNNFINMVRVRLQKAINDVYDYLENLLDGKEGYIQGKWTKRSISYGTRNVITSIPKEMSDLTEKDRPNALSSQVGLFQAAKGLLPITIFQVRTKFLYDIFDPESSKARLIDKKTLKRKTIDISEKARSQWVSDEGLEEGINKLGQKDVINNPIIVDGNYLLLIYEDGDVIKVIDDKDKYPDIDIKKLRPITYMELYYLSIFDIVSKHPAFLTRYPITGLGSINIVEPYLKTTIDSEKKKVYLRGSTEFKIAPEYPKKDSPSFTALTVPNVYLDRLGADFDGLLI